MEKQGIQNIYEEVTMIPQTWTQLTDEDAVKKMNKILDLLDEDDDVQAVYHNWDE
jgi:transcriptional/translational regulatory protein YebC/TACO1